MANHTQNNLSDMRDLGIDLNPRIEKILETISKNINFIPDAEPLRKSEWWKTGKIGAVHIPGVLKQDDKDIRAVLKIQGTKPPTSEIIMIDEFAKQNKSSLIRPPKLYQSLQWNEELQFEALVFEEVKADPVIVNHPATEAEIDEFLRLYVEYKTNCVNTPWVQKPESGSTRDQYQKWLSMVENIKDDDKNSLLEDADLAEQALQILDTNLSISDLQFMHGHFQPGDLIKSGDQYVLFSNLTWGHRVPFYDAVFGYHWWMLGMEKSPDLTEKMLEDQRELWLSKIYALPFFQNPENLRYLNLALLERAVPALMIDRLLIDFKKPQAKLIAEGARKELRRLIELNSNLCWMVARV